MKKWEARKDYLFNGDWHVHSNYVDGKNSITEMCGQAEKNGLEFIAFTEHVRRKLTYSFDNYLKEIELARREFPKLKILGGCEAKVLDTSGRLDVSSEVAKKSDIVVAAFHNFPFTRKLEHLQAISNMIKNPTVDVWAHPTRSFKKYDIHLNTFETDAIIEMCIQHKVLIENNIKDGDSPFMHRANQMHALVCIGSDAHNVEELRKL